VKTINCSFIVAVANIHHISHTFWKGTENIKSGAFYNQNKLTIAYKMKSSVHNFFKTKQLHTNIHKRYRTQPLPMFLIDRYTLNIWSFFWIHSSYWLL